ncbi:MAG: glycerate kinase [Burkholderiales bacterium]|nr:glycerate kinase [Burkholderiales bacterium]
MFDAAVAAADPARVLARHLPPPPAGDTVVIGFGKAAASMAAALEAAIETQWPEAAKKRMRGVVVARYGHVVPTRTIRVLEASHPVPDAASVSGARALFDAVAGLRADDLVICLASGGGSAVVSLPVAGVTPEEKRALNVALLNAGAGIDEMNCVRKHVSAIKGGRLAAACAPARVLTLAISDVPGDDPAVIASGPTVADATTLADARAILARHRIEAGASIVRALADPANETIHPGDARLKDARCEVVIAPRLSLAAAAAVARAHGVTPLILGDTIEGEAREAAKVMAAIAISCKAHGEPVVPPCVILSGGETTVTVRGKGKGGRNQEFALGLALALKGAPGIHALAADTDGIDGVCDAAGAFVTPDSLARAEAAGFNAAKRQQDNDCYPLFDAIGDLLRTGPTLTNVNDFRAILVR